MESAGGKTGGTLAQSEGPHLTPCGGGWNDGEIHTEEEKKRAPDKHGGKGQPPLQVMS